MQIIIIMWYPCNSAPAGSLSSGPSETFVTLNIKVRERGREEGRDTEEEGRERVRKTGKVQ